KWENAETIRTEKPTIYVQSIMYICVRNVLSAMTRNYIANSERPVPSGTWKEEKHVGKKKNAPMKA
ncbi:MAG: hypothetical protein P8012_15155, partial [Desulfobacterales bacterium]